MFCLQRNGGLLLAFSWHFVSCGLVVLDARELLMCEHAHNFHWVCLVALNWSSFMPILLKCPLVLKYRTPFLVPFPSGVVRASNIFPILSAILLLMGGVCIAASRFYRSKRNIILGAGILFVAAGKNYSNITCKVTKLPLL